MPKLTTARLSAPRKAKQSFAENGHGPPITVPASPSSYIRLRVAGALPTAVSVKALPVSAETLARAFTQWLTNGMSAMITIAFGPARSSI